jgi:hypothetical protein
VPIELISNFVGFGLENAVKSVAPALVRGLAGWLYHSLEDGKIEVPEWRLLLHTWLRIIPQVVGLAAFGIPVEAAVFSDIAIERVKDLKKK